MRILVVGGTGTIGKAVVELLKKDHDVIPAGHRDGDHTVDLSSPVSILTLFYNVGKVDAVICTTGLAKFGKFTELKDEDYTLALNNKLMGQVNLIRIGKSFINAGGSITVTSGLLAKEPIPGSTVISMANGGLEAFVRASALELEGIRVNAVSPVFVKETLVMMGMDPATGMSASDTAKTYKAAVEGDFHGKILDVRKFT